MEHTATFDWVRIGPHGAYPGIYNSYLNCCKLYKNFVDVIVEPSRLTQMDNIIILYSQWNFWQLDGCSRDTQIVSETFCNMICAPTVSTLTSYPPL